MSQLMKKHHDSQYNEEGEEVVKDKMPGVLKKAQKYIHLFNLSIRNSVGFQ
jgi:hypothetical protein